MKYNLGDTININHNGRTYQCVVVVVDDRPHLPEVYYLLEPSCTIGIFYTSLETINKDRYSWYKDRNMKCNPTLIGKTVLVSSITNWLWWTDYNISQQCGRSNKPAECSLNDIEEDGGLQCL